MRGAREKWGFVPKSDTGRPAYGRSIDARSPSEEDTMTKNRMPLSPSLATALIEEGSAFMQLAERAALQSQARGQQTAPTQAPSPRERFDVAVIGGGQAGLAIGYYLARQGVRFVILDASARVGDAWRKRWDSLRLFSPARYDALPGMPFPAHPDSFPTKDQMADYLEAYAARFRLPVRSGAKVERLSRLDGRYLIKAGELELEAEHVVVAMGNYQRPAVPAFAGELREEIVQVHSRDYRNPTQLEPGNALIVGTGNSGADIALELARTHTICLAGRDVGEVPFRIGSLLARLLILRPLFRVFFHRVLTLSTPLGRKKRPEMLGRTTPRIRVKSADLAAAGVERAARVVGVRDGLPELEDGRVLDVANVIWCTGFDPSLSFIDLPAMAGGGEPPHERGVVSGEPGLYFVGLHFQYAMSSAMIHGVSRDAHYIAETIAKRAAQTQAVAGSLQQPRTRVAGAGLPARATGA
jgi:putative flavoprotein involved in K+ transport